MTDDLGELIVSLIGWVAAIVFWTVVAAICLTGLAFVVALFGAAVHGFYTALLCLGLR